MCCTNFESSKVSLEAVNKPFYGFSQYMCNSVEVVKNINPATRIMSILSYDGRSHHPATQIMSILSFDDRSHNPSDPGSWIMTSVVK
jgi:hypothetical protein